ncbi:MAG: S1 RNA-binding domain-containing protein, partial [Balneolaceae bacterium]|nr:S1 RNA-binding domain-containing protein [Balneolaceae bacterium]
MTEELKQEQNNTDEKEARENGTASEKKKEEETVTGEEEVEETVEETGKSAEENAESDDQQSEEQDTSETKAADQETEEVSAEEGEGEEGEESDPEAVTQEDIEEEIEPEEVPSFTGEVDETVYTMDELQAASEDYSDEEFHELASMYEDTLNEIEEKEIVTGRVVSVDEDYVVVDIGFKSEGIVSVNEFSNELVENLQPGDEIEVFLDRVEDREGQLILSRRKADILQAWETIERAYETGEVLEGKIVRRIKGGMVVDIQGIDAFLPGSQIDVRPVRDFDAYVGKTMEFQVVKLNMHAENVVVSHRALIESDLEEQRQEILETIEE